MNEKRRIIALILILAVSITVIASVTIFLLYRVAFEGQKARLAETAHSQARMMEAVARFDMQYSEQDIVGGAFAARFCRSLTLIRASRVSEKRANLLWRSAMEMRSFTF